MLPKTVGPLGNNRHQPTSLRTTRSESVGRGFEPGPPHAIYALHRHFGLSKGRELALPVVGAVVPGIGAGGVLHDDGITGAEVVEEPPCVGGADVDTAMADVALALVIH